MEQRPQPQPLPAEPRRTSGPVPMERPGVSPRATARKLTGLKVLVAAALFAGVVGIGAVATGLVQVPGYSTATQTMTATPSTVGDPTQMNDNDSKTIGAGLVVITPQLVKSRGVNTNQTGGYLVTAIVARSPAEDAGLQVNDIVVAIDGVAIGSDGSMWGVKTRMTPFGEKMRLTIERSGAIQDVPVQIGRCSIPATQRTPNTVCPSAAIVK
jgi:membrane-associated protease RseP (regulator of RpoE activity)